MAETMVSCPITDTSGLGVGSLTSGKRPTSMTGNCTIINLPLPPGSYTFHLSGSNRPASPSTHTWTDVVRVVMNQEAEQLGRPNLLDWRSSRPQSTVTEV